jgi:hypothetical protein
VRIDEPKRRLLTRKVGEDTRQDQMLEDIGEIAGMKCVAIVHENSKKANDLSKQFRMAKPPENMPTPRAYIICQKS